MTYGDRGCLFANTSAVGWPRGWAEITTLHGMRGVGKTVLAAAYAERHRADYRATWWVRAETPDTMRADLVSLGVRLGWVAADDKEEPALEKVRERLRDEGEGLFLVYDNAIDAASVRAVAHGLLINSCRGFYWKLPSQERDKMLCDSQRRNK